MKNHDDLEGSATTYGRALARHYQGAGDGEDAAQLTLAFQQATRTLQDAYRKVSDVDPTHQEVEPALQWFIENFYMIEAQIAECRLSLTRLPTLPRMVICSGNPQPRVLAVLSDFLGKIEAPINIAGLRDLFLGFQSAGPAHVLTLRELWAIPVLLRLAVLTHLAPIAQGIADRTRDAKAADRAAARLAATPDMSVRQALLQDLERRMPRLSPAWVDAFAAHLPDLGPVLGVWLREQLQHAGRTIAGDRELLAHTRIMALGSARNAFGSMRVLSHTDWRRTVEAISAVETILRGDPAGCYASMDFASRNRYRNCVEVLAKRANLPEWRVAQAAITRAAAHLTSSADGDNTSPGTEPQTPATTLREAHIGFWLIGAGAQTLARDLKIALTWREHLARFAGRHMLLAYLGPIAALTAAIVLIAAPVIGRMHPAPMILITIALAIAASHLAVALVNAVVTLSVSPKALPRLDLASGIPDALRTVVVVPCMLNSPKGITELAAALELRYLGNRDPNLFFVLASDFTDASQRDVPGDAGLLAAARTAITALNRKYAANGPPRFALFHRNRRWNVAEGVWMGWERKRGKLVALNRFLRGHGDPDCALVVGDASCLRKSAFVITLDADTTLPPETGRRLVATLAHPLNRPVWDGASSRVIAGHGVLQPRVATSFPHKDISHLARLYGDDVGLDPYSGVASDVYYDLYGEASFFGKGIYDIDAFSHANDGRFPENMILSHDLLEGNYARAGLASDIVLHEDHPGSYATDARRRHRWTRGDWQNIAWLLPFVPGPDGRWRRNQLGGHHRWKILDNLRRSLVPAALLLLLLQGWLVGTMPLYWTLMVLALMFAQPLLLGVRQLWLRDPRMDRRLHRQLTFEATRRQLARAALPLLMMPFEVFNTLDAIMRGLWRLLVSRRHRLQWQTASDAADKAETSIAGFYRLMWPAPALGLVVALLLPAHDTEAQLIAIPFLLSWVGSPLLAWWLGQLPAPLPQKSLSPAQRAWLGGLARRNWHYFEHAVGPQDHGLPCDNIQKSPVAQTTHRTSPTNIGLYLTAVLSAWDFGYLTRDQLVSRLGRTLNTLEALPRYRGHFFNWYDTQTLIALPPAYISTVDSGNLLACLLATARGLEEIASAAPAPTRMWRGLCDGWHVLASSAGWTNHQAPPGHASLARAQTLLFNRRSLNTGNLPQQIDDLNWLIKHLDAAASPSGHGSALTPQAQDWLPHLCAQAKAWRDALTAQHHMLPDGHADRPAGLSLHDLADRCRALTQMDFDFLWEPEQRLLSIGYDMMHGRRDKGTYDLLASEARLTSFVAIAQGKLPLSHWLALGRPLTASDANPTLMSWGGTMFEYLMPLLWMPDMENTLLTRSCKNAVTFQIEYGRRLGLPWGMSESGYSSVDPDGLYQYRTFGVPKLGYRRGLDRDRVIAPYASALALMIRPAEALRNLHRLERLGALSAMGFYEALDFTPERVPPNAAFALVDSHMAHHQGMTLLALSAILNDRPMQRRFRDEPMFRAYDILLHEKIPVMLNASDDL